jgi:hypothetical protein
MVAISMTSHLAISALRPRRIIANIALACGMLSCCALIVFPPTRFAFYPACPIHEYFGILCPGCGATRALAVLLRGHLIAALQINALLVLLLPFALCLAINTYMRAAGAGEFRWPRVPVPATISTLITAACFTIVRNVRG